MGSSPPPRQGCQADCVVTQPGNMKYEIQNTKYEIRNKSGVPGRLRCNTTWKYEIAQCWKELTTADYMSASIQRTRIHCTQMVAIMMIIIMFAQLHRTRIMMMIVPYKDNDDYYDDRFTVLLYFYMICTSP